MPSFVPHPRPAPERRNLKKVPFVELFDGRLQGVVSSGSDDSRVYVSLILAGTRNYYCSTNNNRPCGGLRGGGCKHLDALVQNAIAQYGAERMSRYLGLAEPQHSTHAIVNTLGGTQQKVAAGEVFARFLDYLRYVELPSSTDAQPELAWFVTG